MSLRAAVFALDVEVSHGAMAAQSPEQWAEINFGRLLRRDPSSALEEHSLRSGHPRRNDITVLQ